MGTTAENAVPSSHAGSTTWLVEYGDTLTGISLAVYGTTDNWMYIYNANRDDIHNPDSLALLVGTVLTIPTIRNNPITSESAVAYSHKGATTWTIQYGDTLTGISKSVYGVTSKWEDIYKANSGIILDPNSLKELVGYPLVIPQDGSDSETITPPEFTEGTDNKFAFSYNLTILHEGILFTPSVEDEVTIEWDRSGVPGKLEFTVPKYSTYDYSEGDQVKFYYGSGLLFVGYVFTKERTKEGLIKTTCYDQTRYLKNKFSYVFQQKTASEIVKSLCEDFGLNTGTIEDSEFQIPAIAEENSEAFDIILSATEETLANNGNMFVLYDNAGNIEYKNVLNMVSSTLICEDTAEDFSYKTSIDEETYNRIVLYYKPNNTNGVYGTGSGASINVGGKLPAWVQQENLHAIHPNGRGYPGQCTWYAGDRLEQFGVHLPVAMGNGGQWADSASSLGYPIYVGQPFVGAGACMSTSFGVTGISWLNGYGHIAIVEDVYSDGSILCSEFWGSYEDYVLHTSKYSATSVANMKFIDFGIRVDSEGSEVNSNFTSTNGVTSSNSQVSVDGVLGTSVTRWADYIVQASSKYNIPADLIGAVIWHESRGQSNVVSSAGAIGLMQLLPSTGAAMGATNLYDPQQNIDAGTKYLKYLSEYGGKKRDMYEILRGYWGGPGNMENTSLNSYPDVIATMIPNELTGMSGTTTTLNSIEDGNNSTTQVFIAEDPDSIKRWGILQYYESVDSDSIGQKKADSLLNIYNRKSRTFSITNAFGDPTVRGGTMIPVNLYLGDIQVNNYMLVSKVTHHFKRDMHFMDLDLEGAWDE